MPLVVASDFEGLPQEPVARWLQLRDLVEKRLDENFNSHDGGYETYDLLEYVNVLSAASEELGVGNLKEVAEGNIRESFDGFRAGVAGLSTRLSLRSLNASTAHSVALSRPRRGEILSNIESLRLMISRSDISVGKKTEASRIVDQLQILILEPRTDIARVGILLAAVGAFAVGTTSLLADLPPAIGTISALIGADKQDETAEFALIETQKKTLQIQDLREPQTTTMVNEGSNDDDQIPF